ncbi:hypothetical protein QM012_002052 [Aureobasidium pullulans]|uniref:A-kinase anchor protein 7-like phosphoesterase domain-containing protein n=1 Tax=Aureobasidium pullulans TaxID=5580 RepID=A0ABR0TDB4_AURPU
MSLNEEKLVQANTLLQSLNLNNLLREATTPTESSSSTDTDLQNLSSAPPSSLDISAAQRANCLNSPLMVSLESLEPMQSPSKTSILYICPRDPTNRLQILCQAIRKTFTDAGLLVPDTRPLKLHATIVNTIYVKGRKKKKKPKAPVHIERPSTEDSPKDQATAQPSAQNQGLQANEASSGHGPSAKSSLYLNATSLRSTYKDHIWASDVPISRIAICEMGVKKQFSSSGQVIGEAYKEVAVKQVGFSNQIEETVNNERTF